MTGVEFPMLKGAFGMLTGSAWAAAQLNTRPIVANKTQIMLSTDIISLPLLAL